MTDQELNEIYRQTHNALEDLFRDDPRNFRPIRLLVIGCSSSEIGGGVIGHQSSKEYGETVVKAVMDYCRETGAETAFQCCEHLNRALVTERTTAEKYQYEIVQVIPQLKAGGSLATAAWKQMEDPVAVLAVQADAGLDIGQTLIGMHLKRVAVPLRIAHNRIGKALVTSARTRPMLIGGERAIYSEKP